MKKLFAVLISMLVMTCTSLCFAAETYQMVYESNNFTENMKDDQAVTETFNTPYGILRVQMRKLWQASSDKKMHVISWLNDKRIADDYYPEVKNGYTFRVIKNVNNSELFYVIQSIDRAYLYGYSNDKNTMMTYIDSLNYSHDPNSHPYIVAIKDGTLVLAFEQARGSKQVSSRYRFFWDNSKKWFGYTDLGKNWPSINKDKQ